MFFSFFNSNIYMMLTYKQTVHTKIYEKDGNIMSNYWIKIIIVHKITILSNLKLWIKLLNFTFSYYVCLLMKFPISEISYQLFYTKENINKYIVIS